MDSDSASGDEGPEDVKFSDSRKSAAERVQAETRKAKEIKEQRKAVISKKQAWFRESKVGSGHEKRKAKSSSTVLDAKESSKAPKSPMKTGEKSTDHLKDHTDEIRVVDDQSDIDMEEDIPLTEQSEKDATAKETIPSKKGGVKVISLKTSNQRQYGAWRSDAAKFARERFNPPGIQRISAAKWISINAKRTATRTARTRIPFPK